MPEDYISDITSCELGELKPILGGYLKHGLTLRERYNELPTSIDYWIFVSTHQYSELSFYEFKLKELGFQQCRNEKYYRKQLFFHEIRDIEIALRSEGE